MTMQPGDLSTSVGDVATKKKTSAKTNAKTSATRSKKPSLLLDLRARMTKAGDPARALAQQAYMKSAMPCHGLPNATMRALCKEAFADYDFEDAAKWREDVLAIWRGAEKREERYAAINLVTARKARALLTNDAMPMLEEMIVTGAWWDYVDEIATHAVAVVLKRDVDAKKTTMRRRMLAWSKDDDIWKRRTAIIAQLPFKKETDLDLLYACIEPSIGRSEFWLRKAIGWALRAYAWTDPEEIRRYVELHEDRLSYLSKREALKNIGGYTRKPGDASGRSSSSTSSATSSPGRGAKRRSASSDPRTPSRARRVSSRSGG